MTDEMPSFRAMMKSARVDGLYNMHKEVDKFVKVAHPVQMNDKGQYVFNQRDKDDYRTAAGINLAELEGDIKAADDARLNYTKRTGVSDEDMLNNTPEGEIVVDENGDIDESKGIPDVENHGIVMRKPQPLPNPSRMRSIQIPPDTPYRVTPGGHRFYSFDPKSNENTFVNLSPGATSYASEYDKEYMRPRRNASTRKYTQDDLDFIESSDLWDKEN